jgi:Fe-S cluster assembly scaffold protein SufB
MSVPQQQPLRTDLIEYIVLDGSQNKYDTIILLDSPGQNKTIRVYVHTLNDDSANITLRTRHLAPNTHATIEVRAVTEQISKIIVTGIIEIEPDAHQVTSYFSCHVLQFDRSKAIITPSLAINTNDIACSHAATIRTITDADLLYLRSRGISRDQARQLMVESFTAPVRQLD